MVRVVGPLPVHHVRGLCDWCLTLDLLESVLLDGLMGLQILAAINVVVVVLSGTF